LGIDGGSGERVWWIVIKENISAILEKEHTMPEGQAKLSSWFQVATGSP
jgi:hypothetical protein